MSGLISKDNIKIEGFVRKFAVFYSNFFNVVSYTVR